MMGARGLLVLLVAAYLAVLCYGVTANASTTDDRKLVVAVAQCAVAGMLADDEDYTVYVRWGESLDKPFFWRAAEAKLRAFLKAGEDQDLEKLAKYVWRVKCLRSA